MSESEHPEPAGPPAEPHAAFQFEGDDVTDFVAQLPAIRMPTDEPFQRGTLLDLRVRVRVRSVGHDENRAGQIVRTHRLALEECHIANVITPAMIRAAVETEAAAGQAADGEHVITERPGPEDLAERPDEPAPEMSDVEQEDWSELAPEERAARRRQDVESWDQPEQQEPAEQLDRARVEPLVVGQPDTEQAEAPAAAYNPGF